MRAQINPHFLFNALNAIASLVHRDAALAESTVEQLSEVFRYTLKSAETEWVRLAEEIDFLRAYLEVEKARFSDRLRVEIEVDEAARDVLVPALMIQTLVENAIKHGVSRTRGPATFSLSARREEDEIHLTVSDNGPGFTSTGAESGYGLRNVKERLEGYFRDRARLEVGRDDEAGLTRVSITVPAPLGSPQTVEAG